MTTCEGCGFHNLPGTGSCLRCRRPLGGGVAVAAIDVHPPRASGWSKGLRRALSPLDAWRERARARHLPSPAAGLGLVPGLPSLVRGRPRRALVFAGLWTLFALLSIEGFGATRGNLVLGLALSTHALSALDPYQERIGSLPFPRRIAVSLATYAALVVSVYLPVRWIVGRNLEPLEATAAVPGAGITKGDVILVRRRIAGEDWPVPGDLVAARRDGIVSFERVLGLPGDRLVLDGGRLLRNGDLVAPEEGPLVGRLPDRAFAVTVPEGKVALWPYAPGNPLRPEQFERFLCFDRSDLIGSPWRIYQPRDRRHILD